MTLEFLAFIINCMGLAKKIVNFRFKIALIALDPYKIIRPFIQNILKLFLIGKMGIKRDNRTSNIYALSAHLVIADQMVSKSVEIVRAVRQELSNRFNISHTTLQLECESCPSGLVCELDQPDSPP